jgi:UDP-glucose 4-epimerase
MWCCPQKAKLELGWEAEQGVEKMCADLWRFQQKNPHGYVDNNN